PVSIAPRDVAPPTMAPPADQVLRIDLTSSGAQTLNLSRGKSAIIELPVDVRDMLVTNPAVADAVLRGPRRIYVLGMALGATDAVFFDASGRKILSLAIRVEQDSTALEETLRRVLPNANIQVQAIRDSVILTGAVANANEAGVASQIASKFVDKPENVLNMLTIAGKDQVMLKVRIVEVQRNIIKQLGFNTGAVLGQLGGAQYSFGMSPTFGVNGALVGGMTGGYKLDTTKQPIAAGPNQCGNSNVVDPTNHGNCVGIDRIGSDGLNSASAMVQAFERVGLLRTLAEPNLTVVSGEAGKFLVGGEFPVPVAQDSSGRISLEFKPYGVGLGYTPVVMSGGRISLKLSTEVSELTSLGAFTLASTTGGANLSVPGLTVRRAETTVELPSGGSLMIAGLLQQQSKQNIDALPGMTNLPILGSLFRSRDYLNGETELVVIITPYIVDPTKPQNLQTPADGLQTASDMGTVLLGRLNKVVKAPVGANSGRAYQGPVGYVIE
ncbi:MAG TPA: type II and III secretion system protein family protein, partial [Caulobacter sp.]|nr:type II and III secretion system protein family protein [Caulobacter sp.]